MIKKLTSQLESANLAYAKGLPFLTDEEYDKLWATLYKIDPTSPALYHTGYDPTIQSYEYQHLKPIYGTQKAITTVDLKPFLARFANEALIISPKYDGVGATLYMTSTPGEYKLILFGDGTKGKDISQHLNKIESPPLKTSSRNVELIIPNHKWNPSLGKNPRNAVAGLVMRNTLDLHGVIKAQDHNSFPSKILSPPYDLERLNEHLLELYYEWKQIYPIDGIMLKVANEDTRLKAAHNGNHYNWSIAWKPPISTAETTVLDIEFNVSRSGRIIPKIQYTPIDLCGTTNQFVTANNVQWLREKLISIGDTLTIGKAGEIIPQILEVKHTSRENFYLPRVCPVCSTLLEQHNRDLICTGSECISKISKQITYFYSDKGMNLKGVGEAMIIELLNNQTLYDLLVLKPWALLDPVQHNITSLVESIWGTARYQNYLNELVNITSKKNPAHFVASLGYKNLAYKKSLQYWQLFKETRDPKKLPETFLIALNKWLAATTEIRSFKFLPLPEQPKIRYCITGKLSTPREDLIAYLTKYQWEFSNQVSGRTDLLILGDLKKESTKLSKAKEISITIISEDQINQYIK